MSQVEVMESCPCTYSRDSLWAGLWDYCLPPPPTRTLLPEKGVLQIQQVTGFGACLVHLGHNTDVIALSGGIQMWL